MRAKEIVIGLGAWVWATNLTLVLVLSCAHPPQGPYASVRLYNPAEWTAKDLHDIEAGIVVWQGLGFIPRLENEPKLPLCPNDWYKRKPQVVKCQIRVGLKREHGLMVTYKDMGQADRDTDTVVVDATLHSFDLIHVVAHELGHILLNVSDGKHTSKGVMVSGGWEWVLSEQDTKLACEAIGRGCP